MTNGEMIKVILKPRTDQIRIYGDWVEIEIQKLGINFSCMLDWWNAEYKEPTTKDDLPHCQHTNEEIAKSFIEDVEAVKDQLPCGQMMDFPKSFDEFAKDYGFKDKDEVYTNGIELIPVYRVKQWLEHISTTKNDLGVDCISREQAQTEIEMNAYRYTLAKERGGAGRVEWHSHLIDIDDAVDIIRNLPPVTPQERKGHWKLVQRGKYIDVCCSNCEAVRIKEYAYNYTIDELDEKYEDLKRCHECVDVNYCPNCGAKMVEPQEVR